jgi:hypothetical protein
MSDLLFDFVLRVFDRYHSVWNLLLMPLEESKKLAFHKILINYRVRVFVWTKKVMKCLKIYVSFWYTKKSTRCKSDLYTERILNIVLNANYTSIN